MSDSNETEMATRPPSVDQIARSISDTGLPHPLLVDAARTAINEGDFYEIEKKARLIAEKIQRNLIVDVINATGVLLHTNLGRAPITSLPNTGQRFTNLEFNLDSGQRGSRQDRAAQLLAKACKAENAMVVNNCASAVLLTLAALSENRGVAVSRGELVEIGGGFRIPDVMDQSGAQLVEVGTTNRTHQSDFEKAITKNDIALLMKVHRSNYQITGFTETVEVKDMVGLGVPVVADIGSGLLDVACPWLEDGPPSWLVGEPAAKQILEIGSDLVIFSGDKLLGGPQAGIIAGKSDLIETCKSHPLARVVRPGGLVMSSLQEIALSYLKRDGQAIPFWRMATISNDKLLNRAKKIKPNLIKETVSTPGGGTLPGVEIPSVGLALPGDYTEQLRNNKPPIIARVVEGETILDLRTIHPDDDSLITKAINGLD